MLIECPRCRTQAQLDGSRRGARVRCSACGTVFRTGAREMLPGGLFWGLAAAVVAGIVLVLFLRREKDEAAALAAATDELAATTERPAEDAPAARPELVDGWESAPVQSAVRLHEAAHAGDETAVRALLDRVRLRDAGTFADLDEAVTDLLTAEEAFAVRAWKPYDGHIVVQVGDVVTVRLACVPQDAEELPTEERYAKRWFQWRLARAAGAGGWRAFTWSRWISPEEERAARPRIEGVTLSDGSRVVELEPGPREHLPDTPPELRATIDGLLATMLDLDLTVEASRAQAELVALGKPAIPVLLNELFVTPLATQDDAIRCNLVVQTLRRITGQSFGFRPQVLEGSGVGTTEERRASAVRQWFAWWHMHQDDFEVPRDDQSEE